MHPHQCFDCCYDLSSIVDVQRGYNVREQPPYLVEAPSSILAFSYNEAELNGSNHTDSTS